MSAPSASPGLRERKKLATFRAIRAAALELFDASSFEAVSVEEIAAAAGVSKTTFFNYFATKEAVVIDPDPEAPEHWSALMEARPAGEPVWDSIQAVVLGYLDTYADRIALHCRLKLGSPQLSESARDTSDRFWRELSAWAMERDGADPLRVRVIAAASRTATATAHELWAPDEPFERFVELTKACFAELGRGFAAAPGR